MAASQEFADYVIGQMAGLGPVSARRMFGGFGLYLQGLMFALIVDDQLYLKADGDTVDEFVRAGSRPFTYQARGREVAVRYYEAPAEVFDDGDVMADWAGRAFAAARRARPAVALAGRKTAASRR